jgi:aspartate racemase
MTHKIAGVIGGMGPDATVELMKRVIAATPAQDDADHIHMLVDNNPKVPSRLKALLDGGGENPGPVIAQMAKRLEQAGADFLVIPCNTAHYYHHYAQEAVTVPVWHLIRLSLQHINEHYPVRRIGLLASSAVQKIQLFEPFFGEAGLALIYPDDETQASVMQVIRAVKAGTLTEELLAEYNAGVAAMPGVEAYLLGCSELSVLLDRHEQSLPVIDALQVLAEAIVAECS